MQKMIKTGFELATTTGVTQIITNIVDVFVKPKFEEMYNEKNNEVKYSQLEEALIEYMKRSYEKYEYMNTIVFKNSQKKLYDLYIPLTVIKISEESKEQVKININKYRDDFIPIYKKILLVDTAGMGKSTLLKYLYLKTIEEAKGIPILIELRKLEKDSQIVEFIKNEMNSINAEFDIPDIIELIKGGDFIFFLDGYDEIIASDKEKITEHIQDFISKTSNSKFIISSREENELSCFGDFQRFDIKPLSKEEAYNLIKKYGNNGEKSNKLIEKLNSEENFKMLKEFLSNPLMVSLLYKAYEYKETIPYKKNIFYRQVYDALFEEHDLSKGGAYIHNKRSGLDLEDFHKILRYIGFASLKRGLVYSKEQLIELIKSAKKRCMNIEFKENDFINDVTHSVPIFVKEGVEYRWSHKSFQEYFAAAYILTDCKEKQNEILKKMTSKDKFMKYFNILDFIYDMDYDLFARIILYPIIKDMEEYFNNKYKNEVYKSYDIEEMKIRKAILFNDDKICIKKLTNYEKRELEEAEKPENDISIFIKNLFKVEDFTCAMFCSGFIVLKYGQMNNGFFNLLSIKRSNLIKRSNFSNSKEQENILKKLSYDICYANDEPDNVFNNKEIFKEVTTLLVDLNTRNGEYFNYDECMKLKQSIETNIQEEEDFNFI